MPFKDLDIKKEGNFTIENKKEVTIEDKIIKCVSSIKFRVNELSYLKFQYEQHHQENENIINKINNIIKVLNIEFVSSIDDLNATLKGLYKEDKTLYTDKKEYKDEKIQTDNTGNIIKEVAVQTDKIKEEKKVINKNKIIPYNQAKTEIKKGNKDNNNDKNIKKEIKPETFDQDVMRYVTKEFREIQDKRLINFFDKFVKGRNLKQVKEGIADYLGDKIGRNTEEAEEAEEIMNRLSKYFTEMKNLKETCKVVEICNKFLNLEQEVDKEIKAMKKRKEDYALERIKQQIADEENFNAFL